MMERTAKTVPPRTSLEELRRRELLLLSGWGCGSDVDSDCSCTCDWGSDWDWVGDWDGGGSCGLGSFSLDHHMMSRCAELGEASGSGEKVGISNWCDYKIFGSLPGLVRVGRLAAFFSRSSWLVARSGKLALLL